jgi:hypothetical protein
MKPFQYAVGGIVRAAAGLSGVLMPVAMLAAAAAASPALAQRPAAPAAQTAPADAQDANEAAGLPNLKQINRPAGVAHSAVEINAPRVPSFYEKSGNGTSITEYRDRGKPVDIQVQSNFGTRYQMSASPDTSPQVHDSGKPSTRLPSIQLKY